MTRPDQPRSIERTREDPVVHVERARPRRWWPWIVVVLAGYLLFCHGCHRGDHDNELFVRFTIW